MKKELLEEIERINQLIDEAEKLTLGQKIKMNPISFITKYKDDFIDYFNRIAAVVNREDFCENKGAVAQQAVNSMKALMKKIAGENGISEAQLIDYVVGKLDSGIAQTAINIAHSEIPKDNVVPKEILDAVLKYFNTSFPQEGPILVTSINDMIKKLNQPVRSFCDGSSMQDKSDAQANYGELRQTAPQQIKSKEAPKLQTNAPKPKLNTKGTLAQQAEKNRPLQNVASKVKEKIQNLRGNRGGTA
jgi:hypothetical protein